MIFVDGGLIEAFANDLKAITPMVAPNVASGLPATRTNRAFVDGFNDKDKNEVDCVVSSWQLKYIFDIT